MATLKNLVDETTNIKNEIITCHSNLKGNLTNLGVECSSTDKLSDLIDKTNEIKKFPKGWDNEKHGEVFSDDLISEGDAVVLQTYGDWDKGMEPLINPFDEPVEISGSAYSDLQSQFTPDGKFLITGSVTTPFYRVDGEEFKYEDIATSLTSKTYGEVECIAVSEDSEYIFVFTGAGSNPYYFIYRKTDDGTYVSHQTFSSMSAYSPDPRYARFSKDKKFLHLFGSVYSSMATSTPTVCNYFELNNSTGKYVPNSISPNLLSTFANVKKDSVEYLEKFDAFIIFTYVSAGSDETASYLVFFDEATKKYSTNHAENYFDIYNQKEVTSVACSPDGRFVVIGNKTSNSRIVPYKYDEALGKYKKLPVPSVRPSGTGDILSIKFDNSGNYFVVTHNTSPYHEVYKWNGSSFQQTTRLNYNFTKAIANVAFSPDNKLLYVGYNDGDYNSQVFLTETKNIVSKYEYINLPIFKLSKREVGIALETKNKGEQIKVNIMPKLVL
ncbi:MAG: hypothetical protein J6D47_19005 [Peptostreptococcaceae bacterium]|nr:hypothetical protein [Peptostreptococcaceae bacterium]